MPARVIGYGPPYGMGTSSVAPATGGSLLRDTGTGAICGSRKIDPITKDYVIDANGRTLGMTNAQQSVLLAVSTELGSSAVRGLGQDLRRITRVGANFQRQVRVILERAVQHLVDAGIIEVIGTEATILGQGRAQARLLWRDLENNTENVTVI